MLSKFRQLHWGISAILSLILSAFIFIVVPAQTYLGSQDIFEYSYFELFCSGAVGCFVLGVSIFVVISCLELVIGRLSQLLTLALIVCLYLETGILSIGLPALNGVGGFCNLLRGALDAMAWIAVFVIIILFRRWVIDNIKWFVIALSILIIASVFDAGSGSKVGLHSPLSYGFHPRYDVVKSIQFSKHRNVLVYILDMTPATIITEIMERNPELKDKFPGFTCFRKNLCMHDGTAYGLPALMTGKYFGQNDDLGEFGQMIYTNKSFLYPYVVASNSVYYSAVFHNYGFTNRLRSIGSTNNVARAAHSSGVNSVLEKNSTSIPYLRMKDAILIRTAPYLLKNHYLLAGLYEAAHYQPELPSVNRERAIADIIEQASFSSDKCALLVVHTCGLHWPISFDRNGKLLPRPITVEEQVLSPVDIDKYIEAMSEAGVYVMKQVGKLMDVLRMKGIYDKTAVIIATDHGCEVMKSGENHGSESGVLWVKPEHSTAEFTYDDSPTTNAKIHDLLVALKDKQLTIDKIAKMLSSHKRIFRADFHGVTLRSFGGKLHYQDWVYDDSSELLEIIKK